MSEDSTFFGKLKKEFKDLEKLILERKYIVLEPKKKLIVPTALTKNFYYNHIFYKSPFDQTLFINLNGKVLKYEHPKFTSYLGWKREIIQKLNHHSRIINYKKNKIWKNILIIVEH